MSHLNLDRGGGLRIELGASRAESRFLCILCRGPTNARNIALGSKGKSVQLDVATVLLHSPIIEVEEEEVDGEATPVSRRC